MHPLLWRGATALVGDGASAGFLLANLSFLLGLLLLHRLALRIEANSAFADRVILLLAFAATSYFFALPWSESLFLLLSVATFLAALERRWILLFVVGASARATRFVGIFLVPTIFLLLWPHRRELPRRAWLALALFPLWLALFMLELWRITGNPFAFSDIQIAWGRQLAIPWKALGVVLLKPYAVVSDWNFRPLNFATFVGGCVAIW